MRSISCSILLVAMLGTGAACNNTAPDTIKSETKTKTETPEGTKVTQSATEKVGDTVNSTTSTTIKTPDGSVDSKSQTVLGTVTEYTAGKKIEVMTGDNDKHSFDLDDAKVRATIDAGVAIGSKVKLIQNTDDSGNKVIEVHAQVGA
ncbi:MAG: hypothetical protein ABI609_06110 [Acidobacteriota bacterium]